MISGATEAEEIASPTTRPATRLMSMRDVCFIGRFTPIRTLSTAGAVAGAGALRSPSVPPTALCGAIRSLRNASVRSVESQRRAAAFDQAGRSPPTSCGSPRTGTTARRTTTTPAGLAFKTSIRSGSSSPARCARQLRPRRPRRHARPQALVSILFPIQGQSARDIVTLQFNLRRLRR
jgi:hypothetical protein